MRCILKYLETNFMNDNFPDPADTNSVISDDLDKNEKRIISNEASFLLAENNLENFINNFIHIIK